MTRDEALAEARRVVDSGLPEHFGVMVLARALLETANVDTRILELEHEGNTLRAEVSRLRGAGKRVADLDQEQQDVLLGECAEWMDRDKTMAQCAHCLVMHPRDASGMLREHTMTCAANPVVQERDAMKATLQQLNDMGGLGHPAHRLIWKALGKEWP